LTALGRGVGSRPKFARDGNVAVEQFEAVAKLSEVPPGAYNEYEIGGREIIVANIEGRLFAFTAICSHMDGPLVQGTLTNGVITCPWHFSEFRLEDGAVIKGPATAPIETYAVKVEGGQVLVAVPS
jgi:nitrite reductase/ring-hydroxylating ferredoxin subunit